MAGVNPAMRLFMRPAIRRSERRVDGAPAARTDLVLDHRAALGKNEIRAGAAGFVPVRVVLVPRGGVRQLLLNLRLVLLGFGSRGVATGCGSGDSAHGLDKSPPR